MTTKEICDAFKEMLPPHKCECAIWHNPHTLNHESVSDYVARHDVRWPSDEAKQRSIATNELWELIWYPETPVGGHVIYAPTLHEALELAKEFK